VTRIIAGAARGRRLSVPAVGTRPTSDRAREAVFSAIESALSGLAGLNVVDLYAGSGALGLEALSRGASRVDFIESDQAAAATLRANIDAVALPGAHVHVMTVERWVRQRTDVPSAQLVVADPPYATADSDLAAALAELSGEGMAEACLVMVERPTRGQDFVFPEGILSDRHRRYGEATMWFGRFGSVAAC
jgi:16S rRNA (guanine966-N2)-methyltransferase